MDVELELRSELMNGLQGGFSCFEEVYLEHALFKDFRIRADVIAVPRNDELRGFVFAFEVKKPSKDWGYGTWSGHIKQAHDYLYARVNDKSHPELAGRIVSSAFLFPTPPYTRVGGDRFYSPYVQDEDLVMTSGAFHAALHFRVGRCFWEKNEPFRRLTLAFGPNDVWNSIEGFVPRGKGLLDGKRQIGSRKVDILTQLK